MMMMNCRGTGRCLFLGKVARDLLEEDALAANTDIPCTSASASACGGGGGGGAASSHEQRHNRPRKEERLNLGSNLSYEILDHHRWGRHLNTLPGEGTSTDTTLQCLNFFCRRRRCLLRGGMHIRRSWWQTKKGGGMCTRSWVGASWWQ